MAAIVTAVMAAPVAKPTVTTKTTVVKVVKHIDDKDSVLCKWEKEHIRVRVSGPKPAVDAEIQIVYKYTKDSGCPKNASYRVQVVPSDAEMVDAETAATVEEWEAEGGITLTNGESVFVKGRETYKVSRARQGDGVFCNCAAWKFQKANPLCRSCKHTIAVCGKLNESLRVAVATVALLSAPKKEVAKPVQPSVSNTRRPGGAKTITTQ